MRNLVAVEFILHIPIKIMAKVGIFNFEENMNNFFSKMILNKPPVYYIPFGLTHFTISSQLLVGFFVIKTLIKVFFLPKDLKNTYYTWKNFRRKKKIICFI